MAKWQKVKISQFLKGREGRFDPDDEVLHGLKRLEKIDFSGEINLSDKDSKTDMIIIKPRDIVISGINVSKGALAVYYGEEPITATIHYSSYIFDEKQVDINYFKRFVKSQSFVQALKDQVKGGIKTEIKPKHFLSLEILLPDVESQKEILSFFKNIENEMNALSHENDQQKSFLNRLRQQVLQEAIEGKLTASWRAHHPELISGNNHASKLLEEIKAEKERLIKGSKIRNEKTLAPTIDPEKPFDLPNGWVWCRLGDILKSFIGGYAYSSMLFKKDGHIQVLRLGNIRPNSLRLNESPVFISNDYAHKTSEFEAQEGDILITMTGTRAKRDYCYTVLISKQAFKDRRLFLNQRVGCFRLMPYIDKSYMNHALKHEVLLNMIFKSATGSANQANIGSTMLKNLLIPLPPRAEQEEIVGRIDKLMAMIDKLVSQVSERKEKFEMLMQSVLREAFAKGD